MTDEKGCPLCGRPRLTVPTSHNPMGNLYRCRCGATYGPGVNYVAGQVKKPKSAVTITPKPVDTE